MLRDITIGQHFPGNSVLHRCDPRLKLVATIAYIVVLFVAPNPLGLALSIALLAALYKVAKIPGKLILKSLKPIVPIVLFTAVLNLFFVTGEGEPLVHIWVLKIYGEGIRYAIMMTIALRFIPTLIEETEKIMNAQKARGAMIDNGTFTQRIKALVPVLIPLFISAFRRADELAMAMECRCYHGGEGRTRLKQLKFTAEDTRCADIITAALLVICATRFFVPGLA